MGWMEGSGPHPGCCCLRSWLQPVPGSELVLGIQAPKIAPRLLMTKAALPEGASGERERLAGSQGLRESGLGFLGWGPFWENLGAGNKGGRDIAFDARTCKLNPGPREERSGSPECHLAHVALGREGLWVWRGWPLVPTSRGSGPGPVLTPPGSRDRWSLLQLIAPVAR